MTSLQKHRVYNFRGTEVLFPFDAYDCQKVYMEKVVEALQNRTDALLESPTGTGKTLCLLCATLAWRKDLMGKEVKKAQQGLFGMTQEQAFFAPSGQKDEQRGPTIIYASRTHTQLQQVAQELKATQYRPSVAFLGSRSQLCINENLAGERGGQLDQKCKVLVASSTFNNRDEGEGGCKYFKGLQRAENSDSIPKLESETVPDIEDLVKFGKRNNLCPFYYSRKTFDRADMVFMPYNYIVDPNIRKTLLPREDRRDIFENSIIIFDEAHNLEGVCAEAASFDLTASDLAGCISETQGVIVSIKDKEEDKEWFKNTISRAKSRVIKGNDGKDISAAEFIDFLAMAKAMFLDLETEIDDVKINDDKKGYTQPGKYIYQMMKAVKIIPRSWPMMRACLATATIFALKDDNALGFGSSAKNVYLSKFLDCMNLIFPEHGFHESSMYRVHIHNKSDFAPKKQFFGGHTAKSGRTLSYWCFSAGAAMREIKNLGVRSIILTSGTLSPMDAFAAELRLEFPVRLENGHVINHEQAWIGIVSKGALGGRLKSDFKTRDTPKYKQELGNTLVNLTRQIPDGLLVFFSSYSVMQSCLTYWEENQIWNRMLKFKALHTEPRNAYQFIEEIEKYTAQIKNRESRRGAALFAVARGKVSEGIDFRDRKGRAVVITGLPFPSIVAPRVRLKREYLDAEIQRARADGRSTKRLLTGRDWYMQQATRAVNQACGRVIRHRNDYGAIILADERFGTSVDRLSKWLRPYVNKFRNFGEVSKSLSKFFRNAMQYDRFIKEEGDDVNVMYDEDTGEIVTARSPRSSRAKVSIEMDSGPSKHVTAEQIARRERQKTDLRQIRDQNRRFAHNSIEGKDNSLFRMLDGNTSRQDPNESLSEKLKRQREEAADRNINKKSAEEVQKERDEARKRRIALARQRKEEIALKLEKQKLLKEKKAEKKNKASATSLFLIDVKETLDDVEYNKFKGVLKAFKVYKKNGDLTLLEKPFQDVLSLFNNSRRSIFMDMLGHFVPNNARAKYSQVCLNGREVSDILKLSKKRKSAKATLNRKLRTSPDLQVKPEVVNGSTKDGSRQDAIDRAKDVTKDSGWIRKPKLDPLVSEKSNDSTSLDQSRDLLSSLPVKRRNLVQVKSEHNKKHKVSLASQLAKKPQNVHLDEDDNCANVSNSKVCPLQMSSRRRKALQFVPELGNNLRKERPSTSTRTDGEFLSKARQIMTNTQYSDFKRIILNWTETRKTIQKNMFRGQSSKVVQEQIDANEKIDAFFRDLKILFSDVKYTKDGPYGNIKELARGFAVFIGTENIARFHAVFADVLNDKFQTSPKQKSRIRFTSGTDDCHDMLSHPSKRRKHTMSSSMSLSSTKSTFPSNYVGKSSGKSRQTPTLTPFGDINFEDDGIELIDKPSKKTSMNSCILPKLEPARQLSQGQEMCNGRGETPRESSAGRIMCCLCKKKPNAPFGNPGCKHIACFSCWARWLAKHSCCPKCKIATTMRRVKSRKIYFGQ